MIMIIQRLFSSKAQKARRAEHDIRVAKEMYGGTEGRTTNQDQLKRVGRRKQRARSIGLDSQGKLNFRYSSTPDYSLNPKNEILDATKGKDKSARAGVEYRATHQRVRAESLGKDKSDVVDRIYNKLGSKYKKEKLKQNFKKGGKIALATGGVIAAGVGAKKLYDKKKKDSKGKENKKN